jgi:multimeric flavodoxin WrbA
MKELGVYRLLAIYGSPRKGGNTDTLLDYFLQGCRLSDCTVKKAVLREFNIQPCTSCGECWRTGRCTIEDDMTPLYEMLVRYERIVCAFPVYFMGPPAIVKAFIDRAQALWVRRFVLRNMPEEKTEFGRKGFLLSTCGYRGDGRRSTERLFSCNITIIKAFYSACGIPYCDSLVYNGIESPRDLQRRSDIKREAIEAGGEWIGPAVTRT